MAIEVCGSNLYKTGVLEIERNRSTIEITSVAVRFYFDFSDFSIDFDFFDLMISIFTIFLADFDVFLKIFGRFRF